MLESEFDNDQSGQDVNAPSLSTTSRPPGSQEVILDSPAIEFKSDTAGPVFVEEDIQDASLAILAQAREARQRFSNACDALTPDKAETHYYAARDALEALWKYASLRIEAFGELLGLVEAAVRGNTLCDLNATQRAVVDQALIHLSRPYVDQIEVDSLNKKFAEHHIDICGPLRGNRSRGVCGGVRG